MHPLPSWDFFDNASVHDLHQLPRLRSWKLQQRDWSNVVHTMPRRHLLDDAEQQPAVRGVPGRDVP